LERGSDLGLMLSKLQLINKNSDYFNRFEFEDETHNESIYDKNRNNFAKRIEHVVEQCTRVSYAVKHNLKANYFPLVLSGITPQLGISGIKAVYPTKS
jgi:arginase